MSYEEVVLTEHSDNELFMLIVNQIIEKYNAIVVAKLSGLDAIYYDLQIGSCVFTIHQETFTGITIFPKERDDAPPETNTLVKEIALMVLEDN